MDKEFIDNQPGCIRCGKCCLANMAAFVTEIESRDLERWKEENREDILHVLDTESPIWVGDHLISSRTGREIHGCPFLVWENGIYACAIYPTRPMVCRQFHPGSSELCPQCKK